MCGIFCSLSRHGYIAPDSTTQQFLQNRGPDSVGQHQFTVVPSDCVEENPALWTYATFWSTVLSLRGSTVVKQPLEDAATRSILCWNGEAWSIDGEIVTGNDSQVVFSKLLKACSGSAEISARAIIAVLSSIRGPFALVFYDGVHQRLYYGRDCLGRRSLLSKYTSDGSLLLSSVSSTIAGESWSEVEANGIYFINLESSSNMNSLVNPSLVPHLRSGEKDDSRWSFILPFPTLNRTTCKQDGDVSSQTTNKLRASLQRSLQLRTQRVREAVQSDTTEVPMSETRVAVLFSGGLDCTILARMCHDLLDTSETIDLLNVAFENPRIHGKLEFGTTPYELCPDRITGRSSHAELCKACPDRDWRFVEVNVPYTETQAHRNTVMTLMRPHNTEMDLSISFALYFASRGTGSTRSSPRSPHVPYSTTAHVLLSGLGADELFGGYQRHATAFARHSYLGLIEELELDFDRLGKRNLGRDDRVISNSGKEVRFPYLDEDFIALALELPVTAKCDFGKAQLPDSEDPARRLEPGKRALRLLAWQLGMKSVAAEKKRAIQFGARTAKMETGKSKGTHVLT